MHPKTMPTFVVKKNIFLGVKNLIQSTINHFFDRYGIENDSEWIARILELEIIQFLRHIFSKTRTQGYNSRIIIYWIIAFGNRYFSSELHLLLFLKKELIVE